MEIMSRYTFLLLLFIPLGNIFAVTIPDEIRKEYATKYHESFVLHWSDKESLLLF